MMWQVCYFFCKKGFSLCLLGYLWWDRRSKIRWWGYGWWSWSWNRFV
jgi:hypothetical protein